MHFFDIASHRLHNQHLTQPDTAIPAQLVAHFGAVQAQDFAAAKWALGMRLAPSVGAAGGTGEALPSVTDPAIEQAFDAGQILRAHILRPTWHFVAPQDIRWIQGLTALRVSAILASADRRELEIDSSLLNRCYDLIITALDGGQFLTREQLGAVLAQAGIDATGRRLGHIVMHAELEALICSGPRRGKQFTYALLATRAPHSPRLERDEALAELARRYFTSHGPATLADFSWWSGLTIADTKIALAVLSSKLLGDQLIAEEIEGKTYYHPVISQPAQLTVTHLLPPYDEYTIAYKDHHPYLDPSLRLPPDRSPEATIYAGAVAFNGQVTGHWRRTLRKNSVAIEFTPFRPLTGAETQDLSTAAQRYGRFLEREVELQKRDFGAV